jgi:hypothetical protein
VETETVGFRLVPAIVAAMAERAVVATGPEAGLRAELSRAIAAAAGLVVESNSSLRGLGAVLPDQVFTLGRL